MTKIHNIALTATEIDELINLLAEEAMRMDDDGREGAFDATPLKAIYRKLLNAKKGG